MARVLYDHVSKQFGATSALKDFNLNIADREFLVLVGPSGCGKSTALRILAGLEQATDGSVYIGDRRVNNLPSRDRDIAMVFQSYALYPHMTVQENIAFGLELRKTPRADVERRVKEAASILGIEPLLKRKPGQLSGGQRQRVALGRAIVREPAVFLLDEPLSNLDAKLRVATRAEISKLHQRLGTTFVYVTHDQVEAMTMATRIAVMNGGIIQQVGTPPELYESPTNRFVAGFIGSPSMNFIEVAVVGDGDGMKLRGETFDLRVPAGKANLLAPYTGKRIIFGIRPEDIHDAAFVPLGVEGAPLDCRVDVTELMGNEVFLYLVVGNDQLLARVDPRTSARPGQEAKVVIDMQKMHAFDPQTEEAIFVERERVAA